MRYGMKRKLFSWAASFTIKDIDGNDVFVVDGAALSLHDRLVFRDMGGTELAVIQKRLLSWGTTYEIYHEGQLKAVIKESLFTLFGHRFTVNGEHGVGDLDANGNFSDHKYTFTRSGEIIAQVTESWFTLTDTYSVDIVEGQDDVLILACTVVIDRCQESARHRS